MSNAKRVLKNLFSLSVAEVANKGIQLVIIMILGRVIMTEGLGVVGVAQGFFVYFFLFSTLGFNIVGAREIAKYPERIREYVNSILTIRVLLSVLMYLILIFIVSSIDKPEIEKTAILIYGLNLFFNAILVDWVYQGTEKMEVLAIRQVATSLLNLLGILLLV
ncbi:MAG: oligosaccharide flippase family protein, partial [Chlorobi bacterium]|nr:oligosaccharide flippase family protein [Chlorobiota bacterium]